MTPAAAKRLTSKRRLTLKQKRAAKELARRAARGVPTADEAHPLLLRLQEALDVLRRARARLPVPLERLDRPARLKAE